MKKFIAILISAMFVLGLSASVYAADLKFGGDAFVIGYTENWDMSDTGDDDYDKAAWGQRVRLKFDAILENGIEVRTRLRVSDARWDGATDTKLGDNGFTGSNGTTGVTPDYAYIHVPVGAVTFDVGHQLQSWGNGFWAWNAEGDRVAFSFKANDMITLGGYVRKDVELYAADNEGDKDSYSLYIKAMPAEGSELGFITVFTNDDSIDETGWAFDAYGKTKISNIALKGEAVLKAGELNSVEDHNPFGMFVAADFDVAPVLVHVAGALATNRFTADNDFKPTFFFGTSDNPIALMDFGSMADNATTAAILASVAFKVNEPITITGLVAYADFGNADDATGDNVDYGNITEFDASFNYQIAKSTAYTIGLAYGVDDEDNSVFGAFHRLAVSF